jgi:hypothetical protein
LPGIIRNQSERDNAMSTLAEQIVRLLEHTPGLTDREITDSVKSHSTHQAPINQRCHALEARGVLVRRTRRDGLIGNYLSAQAVNFTAVQKAEPVHKSTDYIPTYFMQMVSEHGGVDTAKRLLAKSEPQTGLFELWNLGILHESMEAVVSDNPKYHPLFTSEELGEAYRRLDELNYFK